jgi:cytochrome c-type biogenesis protein CcmE
MRSIKTFAACALLGAALAGCDYLPFGYTRIGDVTAAPASFEGKEVRLRGVASPALKIPFTDSKAYLLRDPSGEITVMTVGAMPKEGETVVVRGRVENVVLIAGQSLGVTVKEVSRSTPPF